MKRLREITLSPYSSTEVSFADNVQFVPIATKTAGGVVITAIEGDMVVGHVTLTFHVTTKWSAPPGADPTWVAVVPGFVDSALELHVWVTT